MRLAFSFLAFLLIFGCNSRIKKLENENTDLKLKVDSMEALAENNLKKAKENLLIAEQKGKHVMDSIIIVKNLKVLRLNEGCDNEDHANLLNSIKPYEQELTELGIEVIYSSLSDCGYELHHGERMKTIKGIPLEEELINDIESFFDIKLIDRNIEI